MKIKIAFVFLIVLTVVANKSNAQTIRSKARHDRQRIKEGVKTGELTRSEAKTLANEQKEIHQEVKEAKQDDGKIDRNERREIKRDQREASRHIYRKKHNNRSRQ